MSLEDVERATRIRAAFLQALENDDFRRLPPPVYTRGFVRNYAAFLHLDPDQLSQLYDEAIGYRPQPVRIAPKEPVRIAGLMTPNVAAIGVVLVVTSIVFVWLYSAFFVTDPGRTARLPTAVIPTPTALTAVLLPTPTATAPRPSPSPAPAAVTPERAPTLVAAAATPSSVSPSPAPARTTATPAIEPDGLALKLRVVDAPSWVQIRTDGVVVFSGTLPPGSERTFNAKTELFIHAGRSDAVELVLNGVPQGRLGSPGQAVVRKTFTRPGAA
jgi:cytoskeletal protein RodZ